MAGFQGKTQPNFTSRKAFQLVTSGSVLRAGTQETNAAMAASIEVDESQRKLSGF